MVAFGNVNDDAAFIHYGASFNASGDVYAWLDVRHYSTFNPSSVTGTHGTAGGDGKAGMTVAAVADYTTPQTIDLDTALLKPGLNVFEFFDNRQIPDPTAKENHFVKNTWTTLKYVRVVALPAKVEDLTIFVR